MVKPSPSRGGGVRLSRGGWRSRGGENRRIHSVEGGEVEVAGWRGLGIPGILWSNHLNPKANHVISCFKPGKEWHQFELLRQKCYIGAFLVSTFWGFVLLSPRKGSGGRFLLSQEPFQESPHEASVASWKLVLSVFLCQESNSSSVGSSGYFFSNMARTFSSLFSFLDEEFMPSLRATECPFWSF